MNPDNAEQQLDSTTVDTQPNTAVYESDTVEVVAKDKKGDIIITIVIALILIIIITIGVVLIKKSKKNK
mgnify:CR=1 FL=1